MIIILKLRIEFLEFSVIIIKLFLVIVEIVNLEIIINGIYI